MTTMTLQRILNTLPGPVRNTVLHAWRRCYWWRRTRISPSANRTFINAANQSELPFKLELASPRRPGRDDWTFSDIGGSGDLRLDLTQPLPIPDNSVDVLYSSHFLEHLSYPEPMLPFSRECVRVLKPGGNFSIAVPNARIFLAAYFDDQPLDKEKFLSWPVGLKYTSKIDYVNFVAYLGHEHRHMFYQSNLPEILTEAGRQNARTPEFDRDVDLESRRHESLYASATK